MNVNVLDLSDFLAFCAEKELKKNFFNSLFMKDGFAFGLDSAACAVRDAANRHGVVVDFYVVSSVISTKVHEATSDLLRARRARRICFILSYIQGLEKALHLALVFAKSCCIGGDEHE